MENTQGVVYKKPSIFMYVLWDITKMIIGIAIIVGLYRNDFSVESFVNEVETEVSASVDLTRDLIANEVMSDSTKKAIYMLATGVDEDKKQIETLKEQLAVVQEENVQMKVAAENALIPEATVKEAAVNHVVVPVKSTFETAKEKAVTLWNTYEFQPEKVTNWFRNVL